MALTLALTSTSRSGSDDMDANPWLHCVVAVQTAGFMVATTAIGEAEIAK